MNETIKELYEEISKCHICPDMDKVKALRNALSVSNEIEVFILSQALAENQLRLSGVNFFKLDGTPGSTGKRLEIFLNLIGQSIYPPTDIVLKNGVIIQARKGCFRSVYNTEIAQCYPGKGIIRGDRVPNSLEINNCLNKRFIDAEVNLIKPKLILLMGKLSTDTFYEYILKTKNSYSLSSIIENIASSSVIPTTKIFGLEVAYLPIQHASGANSAFSKMCKNDRLIKVVKNYLTS